MAPWPAPPFYRIDSLEFLELRVEPLRPKRRGTLAGIKQESRRRNRPEEAQLAP
jgi:hypothetical protein